MQPCQDRLLLYVHRALSCVSSAPAVVNAQKLHVLWCSYTWRLQLSQN